MLRRRRVAGWDSQELFNRKEEHAIAKSAELASTQEECADCIHDAREFRARLFPQGVRLRNGSRFASHILRYLGGQLSCDVLKYRLEFSVSFFKQRAHIDRRLGKIG